MRTIFICTSCVCRLLEAPTKQCANIGLDLPKSWVRKPTFRSGANGTQCYTTGDYILEGESKLVQEAYLTYLNIADVRARFLGGSSGANGALCIRGCKDDYDAWDMPGWFGEEMFQYMAKVRYLEQVDSP